MQSAQSVTSIRLEIQKIKNLPPLPTIAQQLLGVINDNDAEIEDITRIIQQDPPLTARILGLANSAFFGFARTVYTLDEAIINVLGLDLVRGLALSIVMGGVFDVRKCEGFNVERYWCSALMTADLAARCTNIMKSSNQINTNRLFLYGLLHNLGILVLTDKFPKLMTEIFNAAKTDPQKRLVDTEQEMLDMDHHQAGAWLAMKWGLPDDVIAVITHHHYPDYKDEYMLEAFITGFCSRTTRNWILGNDILLDDDNEFFSIVDIDKNKMETIAEKCRSKSDEFKEVSMEIAK